MDDPKRIQSQEGEGAGIDWDEEKVFVLRSVQRMREDSRPKPTQKHQELYEEATESVDRFLVNPGDKIAEEKLEQVNQKIMELASQDDKLEQMALRMPIHTLKSKAKLALGKPWENRGRSGPKDPRVAFE